MATVDLWDDIDIKNDLRDKLAKIICQITCGMDSIITEDSDLDLADATKLYIDKLIDNDRHGRPLHTGITIS